MVYACVHTQRYSTSHTFISKCVLKVADATVKNITAPPPRALLSFLTERQGKAEKERTCGQQSERDVHFRDHLFAHVLGDLLPPLHVHAASSLVCVARSHVLLRLLASSGFEPPACARLGKIASEGVVWGKGLKPTITPIKSALFGQTMSRLPLQWTTTLGLTQGYRLKTVGRAAKSEL